MPSYDLTGTVKQLMDQQTFASGFTKREFVVTTEDDRYPQDIKLECVKDKAALLDNVQPGQRVTVTFDLRGNEYNDRFFVNLTAWRVETADGGSGNAAGAGAAVGASQDSGSFDGPPLDQREPPADDGMDEMPF